MEQKDLSQKEKPSKSAFGFVEFIALLVIGYCIYCIVETKPEKSYQYQAPPPPAFSGQKPTEHPFGRENPFLSQPDKDKPKK